MRYKEAYDYFYQVYSSRLDEKVNILFKPGEGISTFREVINFSNIFYDNVNRIEQLRETNYNSQPIEELVKLSKEIQPLENACQELYQYNSSIPEQEKYELLATKILDVSNRMDDGFISIVNHVKDKFEERYNLLKLMDKSELEIIGDLREELSSLISKYNSLEGIFEERNIDNIIISNIKESFSEYVENKRNIELIDSEINQIIETYQSLSEPKDLRAFIRGNLTQFESRNRFAKGRLIKKCEKENYHEMIPRIESLKKEFNYMLEQPEEPIKLKNKINKYTKKLDILLSYVNQIDADNIKTRDKLILNRIKSKVNPNKFSKNKGLNYLSSDIEEVEKSSNLIIEKIQDIYLQDFDFEINKYGLNERKDDLLDNLNLDENLNDICNLVDNYNNLNAEIGNFLQNNYKGTKDQVNYLISEKENINSYIELSSELKNSVLKSKFESLNNLIEIYSKRSFFDINNVNEHEVEKGYKEDSNSRNDNDNNQETNLNSINELINFAIQAYNDCQNKKLKEVCAEIGITKGRGYLPPLDKRVGDIKEKLSEVESFNLEGYERITYNSIQRSLDVLF